MKNSIADQLLEIARIELHFPICKTSVFIAGEGKTAEKLAESLVDEGAVTGKPPYGLVFLLSSIANEDILPLLSENALIIDALPAKSDNEAIFDGKGSFRRIRVVSMTEK